jgi:two-component system chemotaxis response regulator CheB
VENGPISVLVVDDSALMRNLISRIVESVPDLRVAGKAMNGSFALAKLSSLDPDIIILDLEMPEMNGIEFLQERKRLGIEIPVVILSSVAKKGAKITMEALNLGASDFIMKPSGAVSEDIHTVGDLILETVRAYGGKYKKRKENAGDKPKSAEPPASERPVPDAAVRRPVWDFRAGEAAKKEKTAPVRAAGTVELIAIGISTGGPNALREVFSNLDPALDVPILVVQHMPAGFTEEFAKSLDRVCPLEVKEAEEGDIVKSGRILIAPGNRHMTVEKKPLASVVRILDTDPVNGHRPSADVLFESVAKNYGNHAMAVIMTGMGRDGALQIGSIYREGGITIGQDEGSSIVYGMPKVAFENGFIHQQVPLSKMADTICRLVKEYR